MDLMIIYKWLTDWNTYEEEHKGSRLIAPGIIQTMITMFIGFGNKNVSEDGDTQADIFCNAGMEKIGSCQKGIMHFLLVVAGLCVPLMLLVKPFWYHFKANKASKSDDFHKIAEGVTSVENMIDNENP